MVIYSKNVIHEVTDTPAFVFCFFEVSEVVVNELKID